jgi:hypothetical protein
MRAGRGSIGTASILVARRSAALGWWHAACWAKRRRGSAAGRSAWHAREVARAIDKQLQRRAIADAAEARVTAVRGLIAAGGVDGPEDIDAVTRAFAAVGVRQEGQTVRLICGLAADAHGQAKAR